MTYDILATIGLVVLLVALIAPNVALWKFKRASEKLAEALKEVNDA